MYNESDEVLWRECLRVVITSKYNVFIGKFIYLLLAIFWKQMPIRLINKSNITAHSFCWKTRE